MTEWQFIGSVAADAIGAAIAAIGFYLQTKAFVEGDYGRFCTVEKQMKHINTIYKKIVEK